MSSPRYISKSNTCHHPPCGHYSRRRVSPRPRVSRTGLPASPAPRPTGDWGVPSRAQAVPVASSPAESEPQSSLPNRGLAPGSPLSLTSTRLPPARGPGLSGTRTPGLLPAFASPSACNALPGPRAQPAPSPPLVLTQLSPSPKSRSPCPLPLTLPGPPSLPLADFLSRTRARWFMARSQGCGRAPC